MDRKAIEIVTLTPFQTEREEKMVSPNSPNHNNHADGDAQQNDQTRQEDDPLDLSLGLSPYQTPPAAPQPPPDNAAFRPRRPRRNPTRTPPQGKSETVPPAFPWSDSFRATVRSLNYLRSHGISKISGDVQCKKCEQKFTMELDLEEKFNEISMFMAEKKLQLFQRAPRSWLSPSLPKCWNCNQENCVKPVMSEKKRTINWLFLLLSQMLGCCTLEQLKYFCKHTKNHRTGAKDRVLFLTYLGLCKQLDPNGPFDL